MIHEVRDQTVRIKCFYRGRMQRAYEVAGSNTLRSGMAPYLSKKMQVQKMPVFLVPGFSPNRQDLVITLASLDRPRWLADRFALTVWDETSHLGCEWAFQREEGVTAWEILAVEDFLARASRPFSGRCSLRRSRQQQRIAVDPAGTAARTAA
jgi:hypothetical protein